MVVVHNRLLLLNFLKICTQRLFNPKYFQECTPRGDRLKMQLVHQQLSNKTGSIMMLTPNPESIFLFYLRERKVSEC